MANQTQDVLVDTRGYACVTDSARGLWIAVKAVVGRTLPLVAAAEAHRALASRQTTGGLILIP